MFKLKLPWDYKYIPPLKHDHYEACDQSVWLESVHVDELLQSFIDELINWSNFESIRWIISALSVDQLHYELHTQDLSNAVPSLAGCCPPSPPLGVSQWGSVWLSLGRPLICRTKTEQRSNGWRLAACWPVRPPPPPPSSSSSTPPPHPLPQREREKERGGSAERGRKKEQT